MLGIWLAAGAYLARGYWSSHRAHERQTADEAEAYLAGAARVQQLLDEGKTEEEAIAIAKADYPEWRRKQRRRNRRQWHR